MELTPKQQAVEQLKKAEKVLILGHKKPDGDMLGSALALATALKEMGKTVEVVVTEETPATLRFLPTVKETKPKLEYADGKLIRIDTTKIPVKGLKYQKKDDYLDIYLDAEKNLKFEFIEIKNGADKPNLIVVLDTPDSEAIDRCYDETPELFYEVPILNIDHHPGNEYFGTINLVDLTATSTAEILVSLLEALQYKIANSDVATMLLTGIISDTQSFRSVTTTPKSLTVAAQLLAAGAAQQEIISNLYKRKPMALLKVWGEMLSNLQDDQSYKMAWTKLDLTADESGLVTVDDVFGSADELLANTPGAETLLILVRDLEGKVFGRIKGSKGTDITEISKALKATGDHQNATFQIEAESLDEAELKTLKKIHDLLSKKGEDRPVNIWDVVQTAEESADEELKLPEKPETPKIEKQERKYIPEDKAKNESEIKEEPLRKRNNGEEKKADPIENALKSLAENQIENKGFATLKEIMEKKKKTYGIPSEDEEIDVFDEENT